MRTKFIIDVAVLACLAGVTTTSYGQESQRGSGNTRVDATLAFQRALISSPECQVGSTQTVTWQFHELYKLPPATPIALSLIVGGNTSLIDSGIVGTVNNDGSRSCVIERFGQSLSKHVTVRTPAKLRLAVTVIVDGRSYNQTKDVDFMLLPANRQPILVGKLNVPLEGTGDSVISVGNAGNIIDPDGDGLSFKVEKSSTNTNEWHEVARGDTLPLNLQLDPAAPTDYNVDYRLCAEELTTGERLFMEPVVFTVKVKASGSPPLPNPDPNPPANKPADTAPVASAATASVNTANHSPRNLRVRVRPENRVVGGQSVGLHWSSEDQDADPLHLIVRFHNPASGVAMVMSSTTNPFQITTAYVPSERRLELEVSASDGKSESDRQLVELVLLPVERTLVDERQFKDDIKVDQHSMGRRMADAKMFSPGAVDYEFYNDDNGNMQVRVRQPEPSSSDPATGEKKSSSPKKKK